MKENEFQGLLKREIKERLPGCMVLKSDPNDIQGIPDILVLYKNRWGALECKKSSNSSKRPNQDYYISKMNDMSFASFIFPENKGDVLNALEQSLKADK